MQGARAPPPPLIKDRNTLIEQSLTLIKQSTINAYRFFIFYQHFFLLVELNTSCHCFYSLLYLYVCL